MSASFCLFPALRWYNRVLFWGVALLVGYILSRSLYAPGIIGYSDDWNVPSSAHGLWVWGIADFSPWRPIEYGMPLAYPTDLYLKFGLGLFGLLGVRPQLVVALFVTACIAVGFVGIFRLAERLWSAPTTLRLPAALLYVTSPALFDALVPGYITFVFSFCILPWLGLSLLDALRGRKFAWYAYIFFLALSLTQVQFAFFDIALSVAILIGCKSRLLDWIETGVFAVAGICCAYLFIIVNVLGVASLVAKTIHLSEHSWTSLSSPGIFGAFMLVPSVYPCFDQALHDWNILWRLLAVLLVGAALVLGFRSSSRMSRVLATVLALTLVFLNGTNPPLGALEGWFLHLPAMAMLRNVNYVFALVALLLSLLVTVPLANARWNSMRPALLWGFALIWALPFAQNTYADWIRPIPDPNPTMPIVGSQGRLLVFPHLQVLDGRYETRGGVNPNSVETITPIFVRDTPTGVLQASILDRLTDWTPHADTLSGALQAAHVNGMTQLESSLPRYVNSYHDLWLFDAYRTQAIHDRLNEYSGLESEDDGDTVLYQPEAVSSDVQTADSAMVMDGSVEDEVALRSIGLDGLFIGSDQVGATLPPWVSGVVRQVGAPEFLPSSSDVRDGAYVSAGSLTDHRTADFHVAWVDPMASANWWLSENLLSVPHVAITDKSGESMSIPILSGRRHLWLQYYVSRFGGAIALSGPFPWKMLRTRDASLGEYRWVDLGEIDEVSHPLTITSLDGFNGIGHVAVLSADEETADRAELADASRRGRIEVLPNLTFDESLPLDNESGDWKPDLFLSNPSAYVDIDALMSVHRSGELCEISIGSVRLRDYRVTLDGRSFAMGSGSFSPVESLPCDASSVISVNGVPLSGRPILLRDLSSTVQLRSFSAMNGGINVERTVLLRTLPLAFSSLGRGRHLLSIHAPALFPAPAGHWSGIEDGQVNDPPHFNVASGSVRQSESTTQIDLATTHHAVNFHVPLRAAQGDEHWMLVGSCTASKGALVRIILLRGTSTTLKYDFLADGKMHDFHVPLDRSKQGKVENLYIYLFPQMLKQSEAHLTISAVPDVSANLLLWDPRFRLARENESGTGDIGFQRFAVDRPQAVLQYDQTYDEGWKISEPAAHYQSPAGFNSWVFERQPHPLLIFYATGVAYAIAVMLSLAFMICMGFIAIRRYRFPE